MLTDDECRDTYNAAMALPDRSIVVATRYIEKAVLAKQAAQSEPVAYLAWRDGKPCYEGDDAVCEDAVWPVDF